MASPTTDDLGIFAAGTIHYPFQHTFTDGNGTAIDLTGWYVDSEWEGDLDNLGSGSLVIDSPETEGRVIYTFVQDDMDAEGKVEFLIWVRNHDTNPTVRLASDRIRYRVYDGPGDTPST
jgi:hypothetical protein